MKFKTIFKKYLADTVTPVNIFLKIRDHYSQCLLLESSDYDSIQNSRSFIVFEPQQTFEVKNSEVFINGKIEKSTPLNALKSMIKSIDIEQSPEIEKNNGLYGYTGFEAVKYFDSYDFSLEAQGEIPEMYYAFYRFVIVFNHFNNELILIENLKKSQTSQIEKVKNLIFSMGIPQFSFEKTGGETSKISDEEYKELVRKGKEFCQLGEVFQIVYSRRFEQNFIGDEFSVYRALRSINPSPYLFYFDYGNFKMFGSSPESQLVISSGKATINPIAGTYKKTGDPEKDERLVKNLIVDPKENAEHTMLVDLARNDLGIYCKNVVVENYKEIQHFSHVIHIVSKVTGELTGDNDSLDIFAATFPAGTLSGAPKYRAIELIKQHEKHDRGFYGGAIGFFSLSGDINHAITIRSFLSKNGKLAYQAGAGIVVDSVPEKELNEVDNKLGALRLAMERGENIM